MPRSTRGPSAYNGGNASRERDRIMATVRARCVGRRSAGIPRAPTRRGSRNYTHHFPNPYVLYPASWNASASCRSLGSKPDRGNGNSCGSALYWARPIRTGCRPVWSALRDGPHCVPGTANSRQQVQRGQWYQRRPHRTRHEWKRVEVSRRASQHFRLSRVFKL